MKFVSRAAAVVTAAVLLAASAACGSSDDPADGNDIAAVATTAGPATSGSESAPASSAGSSVAGSSAATGSSAAGSSAGSAAAAPGSSGPGPATVTTASDGTHTVTGTFTGEVTGVPAKPQRVVALWRTGSELAELGVVPVGSLEGEFLEGELGADLYRSVAEVPTVGSFEGVDIEKVIAAKPDLIIGMDNGGLSIDYATLAEIAPTVILKIAEPTDVWRNYPVVAEIVDKTSDFTTKNADLDAKLGAIADEYGDKLKDKSVTAFGVSADEIWISTSKSLLYQRLAQAGFTYNPVYTDDPERYVTVLTAENIPNLADQAAIFYQTNLDGSPIAGNDIVQKQESYQRLPAVKAGREYPVTSGVIYTFVGADEQVEDIRAAAKALAES